MKKTIIYLPTFNRKKIAELCIANLMEHKGKAHLRIHDDQSTEFDGRELVDRGDSGEVLKQKLGINRLRFFQLQEFLQSDYEFCYFTDSDTIHDPDFMERLQFMWETTQATCCLYNSPQEFHQEPPHLKLGEDLAVRTTVPGVSVFFSRKIAEKFLSRLTGYSGPHLKIKSSWDWMFCDLLSFFVISEVSYLQHFGEGGIHWKEGEGERALHPTPYLKEITPAILEKIR